MASTASADKLQSFTVSDAVASTHGTPAFNRYNDDLAVIYSQGASPQSIKVAIFNRVANVNGQARYRHQQTLTLATPAAALTPSGGASPSCSHPTICGIKDGFACFWERRDTTIAADTMTAGGMQIEMCKLKWNGSGYIKYASNTVGKGFVLDNTVIAGDAGGTPRCAWRRKNQVGVVYGHQQTYALNGADHTRTWAVRAAYLDFTPDGKPTLLLGGNRTGGSVSDVADGGYVAGTVQTYLVQNIDLDDATASPVFTSGGGLPSCIFDMRGDFSVAYESRNNTGAYTGGVVMRTYKGPSRGSDGTEANCGLNVAALYSSVSDHAASAGFAARRPMMAFRNVVQDGLALTGANHPPILLAYGDQDPAGTVKTTVKVKTITFPLNSNTPTIASLTVPVNTNYDGTAEHQTLPFCVDAPFITAAFLQEQLAGNVSDGQKFKIVHSDGTGEICYAREIEQPTRPNVQAATLTDGTKMLALTYEGQDAAGSGSEEVFLELWQFA